MMKEKQRINKTAGTLNTSFLHPGSCKPKTFSKTMFLLALVLTCVYTWQFDGGDSSQNVESHTESSPKKIVSQNLTPQSSQTICRSFPKPY